MEDAPTQSPGFAEQAYPDLAAEQLTTADRGVGSCQGIFSARRDNTPNACFCACIVRQRRRGGEGDVPLQEDRAKAGSTSVSAAGRQRTTGVEKAIRLYGYALHNTLRTGMRRSFAWIHG